MLKNYLLKRFDFFTPYFDNNIKYPKEIKDVIKRYSLPGVERSFITVVDKIFGVRLSQNLNISSRDVYEADRKELVIYKRYKKIHYEKLDFDIFEKVINDFFKRLDISDEDVYEIEDNVVFDILPKNTSASAPTLLKKKDPLAIQDVYDRWFRIESKVKFIEKIKIVCELPTVIYHRFTPKLDDNNNCTYKIRQIWGIPFFNLFLEVKFLKWFVLVFNRKCSDFFTSGRKRTEISKMVSKIRIKSKQEGWLILCGDLTRFDASIPLCFFKIFKLLIDTYVRNKRINIYCNLVLKYLANTPFIDQDGKKCITAGSNSSGSYLTTVFNTLVMYIALSYSFYTLYRRMPKDGEILVQGDDFLLLIEDSEDSELIKELLRVFNFRLKIFDSPIVNYNQDIEFLGFHWDYNNEPDQSDKWVYSRIIYPEKFVKFAGPDRIIARYISLIFQIKRSMSLFKKFLEYDHFLIAKFKNSYNPELRVLDSFGNVSINRIPTTKLLEFGWRMF